MSDLLRSLLLSLAVVACPVFSTRCLAVDADSLNGLEAPQIEAAFGKPDKVVPGSVGNERWHYGNSVLFLNEGKVVAWSDRGYLAERRKIAGLQRDPERGTVGKESGWVNSWTPEDKADVDEILDDLMR